MCQVRVVVIICAYQIRVSANNSDNVHAEHLQLFYHVRLPDERHKPNEAPELDQRAPQAQSPASGLSHVSLPLKEAVCVVVVVRHAMAKKVEANNSK